MNKSSYGWFLFLLGITLSSFAQTKPSGPSPTCINYLQFAEIGSDPPDSNGYFWAPTLWLQEYLGLKIVHKSSKGLSEATFIDPITGDLTTFTTYQLFLDPYCEKHPKHTFKQAVDALVTDLKRIQKQREKDVVEHPIIEDGQAPQEVRAARPKAPQGILLNGGTRK